MDRAAVLQRLDDERRSGVATGDAIREQAGPVTRVRSPYHAVVFSSLTAENADAAIAAEIEHHRTIGASFEWKLYAHDKPLDLMERLERHGLRAGPREAVLVFDLTGGAGWIEPSDTCRIVRVEHLEQVEAYRKLAEAVFSKDSQTTTEELEQALRAGSTRVRGYIAFAGNRPVSIGRLYTHPYSIFGGLYGGGTLPEFRGRGFYRGLVAARALDAIAAGARFLIVDALPTSRPILERLGFQWLTDTCPCEWQTDADQTRGGTTNGSR